MRASPTEERPGRCSNTAEPLSSTRPAKGNAMDAHTNTPAAFADARLEALDIMAAARRYVRLISMAAESLTLDEGDPISQAANLAIEMLEQARDLLGGCPEGGAA